MFNTYYSINDTASVTESGDTALGLAVRKGKLDVITFLVIECSVDISGELKREGLCSCLCLKSSARNNRVLYYIVRSLHGITTAHL